MKFTIEDVEVLSGRVIRRWNRSLRVPTRHRVQVRVPGGYMVALGDTLAEAERACAVLLGGVTPERWRRAKKRYAEQERARKLREEKRRITSLRWRRRHLAAELKKIDRKIGLSEGK